MTDFTMKTDADGVATITWDTVGKSMNVMNQQGFVDLDGLVDQALADDAIKGVIITSGKEGSFAGGMDLNIIAKMKDSAGDEPARGLMEGLMASHAILRKIERAGMAGLSPDFCGGQSKGQDRPARDHGRYFSRHGRDHAAGAQIGRDECLAVPFGR